MAIGVGARQTPEQRYFDWTSLPFPAEEIGARRATLASALASTGGGVFLVPAQKGLSEGFTFRQADTFWYLTGLEFPDSVLAIDAESRRATLYAPARDARFESASRPNDFPGRPLQADPAIGGRAGLDDVRPIERLAPDVAAWVQTGRVLRVDPGTPGAIERQVLGPMQTWTPATHFIAWLQQAHPGAQLVSAYAEVARTRMVKSAREIDLMRRSARLAVDGIAHAAAFVKDGVDERTLEAEFEAFCKRGGAERLPFASIIKSGPNALWPWRILATHNDRHSRRMKSGELVIFDVGCELNGYVSDTGRTFPVSGTFTPEQRAILTMEVRVADALIAALAPGVTLRDAQREGARAIPEEARPYMQTGLFFGHHLGLSSGDPSLDDEPLAPGMVITVEPWYYNHDRGISVFTEDDILITAGG
ncbi:MAG: Xaa-Pro peptidase family protein, partial [Acidobacteriota bacterium]|nr:Xaa-Pro peptidase family protein [Acidobacteriota bacterium]